MNNDIKIMVDLQLIWDGVLRSKSEIKKCDENLKEFKTKVITTEKEVISLSEKIKKEKARLKENEIKLTELEESHSKLINRQYNVQNERESSALEKELNQVEEEKELLEEKIITDMDTIGGLEKDLGDLKSEFEDITKESKKESKMLVERSERFKNTLDEYQDNYNDKLMELGTGFRSKFDKLTKSSDGKAIVKFEDNVCSSCHFSIPADDRTKIVKRDSVVNCLNCGKFLYVSE